eukprot:TRINITY_DN4781_c0_g2_i1.p1 TRINITY_DN4781_c0_g2~~TRINITY_DN4781_c0_g2_i1.p1  ORF type:complete len:321 (+),score=5.41 TRINITY_DN4781_c0_g2_i1:95-1057(+)
MALPNTKGGFSLFSPLLRKTTMLTSYLIAAFQTQSPIWSLFMFLLDEYRASSDNWSLLPKVKSHSNSWFRQAVRALSSFNSSLVIYNHQCVFILLEQIFRKVFKVFPNGSISVSPILAPLGTVHIYPRQDLILALSLFMPIANLLETHPFFISLLSTTNKPVTSSLSPQHKSTWLYSTLLSCSKTSSPNPSPPLATVHNFSLDFSSLFLLLSNKTSTFCTLVTAHSLPVRPYALCPLCFGPTTRSHTLFCLSLNSILMTCSPANFSPSLLQTFYGHLLDVNGNSGIKSFMILKKKKKKKTPHEKHTKHTNHTYCSHTYNR